MDPLRSRLEGSRDYCICFLDLPAYAPPSGENLYTNSTSFGSHGLRTIPLCMHNHNETMQSE